MKIIAFYLPQFHCIPENNIWWGDGFTEWENVKKSKALFKGHNQPEIPLGKNYYDLLDGHTQEWQARLAKEYGIDGFCYYHYWFSGKLLLEKPMEFMLKNHKIDISFCICWANETWSRTWDGKETDILIAQNYEENREAWKNHFDYLLPFFKDNRYIKHDNKPLMIIYKPQLFARINDMMIFWNELARENGFSGIYWGYQHRSAFDSDLVKRLFNFGIEFEPFYTVKEIDDNRHQLYRKMGHFGSALEKTCSFAWKLKKKILNLPIIYNYDAIWNYILSRQPSMPNLCPGAFTSWDNTPRRGRKGCVFNGASPQKFEHYFKEQYERAITLYHSDYMFINAWNEWAEGAHLEPDEINQYGYLESVKKVIKY